MIIACSSSSSNDDNFQENNFEPEYKLFEILDPYPAPRSAFNPVSQRYFNNLLGYTINNNMAEAVDVLEISADLFIREDRLIPRTIADTTPILERVIQNQYADDFFTFSDQICNQNLGISLDGVVQFHKFIAYLNARFQGEELDQVVQDLIDYLTDREGQTFKSVMDQALEGLGKLLMRHQTGMDALLTGLADVLENESVKSQVYDILRAFGNMTAASVQGKDLHGILRLLLTNAEDYFTIDGEVYSQTPDYDSDTDLVYTNAELGESLRTLLPALQQISMAAGSEFAALGPGPERYLADFLGTGLYQKNVDLSALEDSIAKMIIYDAHGRNRRTNSDASKLSILDHLIFTLMVSNYFGYLDGGNVGEGNHNHGHGAPTNGILTLNDCLFNLTSDYILQTLGVYNLCLDRELDHINSIHRSSKPFNNTDARPFGIDANYFALNLLSGEAAGDVGVPEGGASINRAYNTYQPYSADGCGELNTARWIMGWIARVCWEGQGPYYVNDDQYKDQWKTDYYLIEMNDPDKADQSLYFAPDFYGDDPFRLSPSTRAGAIEVKEIITQDQARHCATWDESVYKNFQWLLYEKKIVLVIPLRIDLGKMASGAVYAILEANGIFGMAQARKAYSNGEWLLAGGTDSSDRPGDARLIVRVGGGAGIVTPDYIYKTVLGSGHLLPEVIRANITPLKMLSFLTPYNRETIITSQDINPFNPEIWGLRNTLLPVVAIMLGKIHEHTIYNTDPTKASYPFKTIIDGLLAPLAKPMFYFSKKTGQWQPRLQDSPAGQHNFLLPCVNSETGVDIRDDSYYLPKTNPTLVTMLSETSYKTCDGIIPLLCQSKLITKTLSLLKTLGAPQFNDPSRASSDDLTTWGPRRQICYGLEQIITGVSTSPSESISRGYGMQFPERFFAENSADIALDTIIEELIGTGNASQKGLSVYPDNRPKNADWKNFNRLVDAAGELLSDKGLSAGKYNLLEVTINMIDKIMTNIDISHTDMRAVRHTLGSILAVYQEQEDKWEYPTEIIDLMTDQFPEILAAFQGHFIPLEVFVKAGLTVYNQDTSFLDYFLTTLDSKFEFKDVITQLYKFLDQDPLITEEDSPLWQDIAGLLRDYSKLLDQKGEPLLNPAETGLAL